MVEVFKIGLRIGKYELTRKLAEGGFGTLFVARDTALDRELVIKFLLPEHANNDQVVQRFLQEGRSLAKIVHPGIVTVYETGEVRGSGTHADGSAYIIMELLHGETLSQRLKRVGRLSVSVAMEICRQVANALQAAHEQGIVHRDLKPDNIMLVRDPALSIGERAKVLDFGIAKIAKATAGPSNATQDGLVFGTPIYMSPEQAKSTASAGPASDIYSLGCILFELLVGRPPFDGSMAELIAHHILTAPPVPSMHAPGIPPHLDQVIGAMMAKSPEERPATMKVVEAILEEKRVVASMARRRTLGGAKLVTQPPPVGGAQPSPAAALAASGQPMVANVRTPPIGVPVQQPQHQAHANAPTQAVPAPHVSVQGGMPLMPSPQSMAASSAKTQAPDQAMLAAGLTSRAAAAPVAPAQWPASSAPQPIAQPQPEVIKPSHPTTLSAVAGATTTAPAKKGGKGLYIGLAAAIIAGGVIAIVAVSGGGGDTDSTMEPATSPGSDTIAKPDDTTPADTKPADTRPVDTKPADTKPADTKLADTKSVDTKPADPDIKVVTDTPTDTKPADTKTITITSTPTDRKPADIKPADTKTKTVTITSTPVDTKPADTKTTTNTKPADTKTTTTTKPADTKTTTTTKPADTKTTTTTAKPTDTKTKPTDTKTKPTETKPKCQGASCQFDGQF